MKGVLFARVAHLVLIALSVSLVACSTGRYRVTRNADRVEQPRRGLGPMFEPADPVQARKTSSKGRKPAETDLTPRQKQELAVVRARSRARNWVWPLVRPEVTSNFGPRGGSQHEGIDLRAKIGTPVYSVDSGRVLYADSRISGYGKMVIVRHGDRLATVYAHNSKLVVKPGQVVRRGQKIALSGNTGHSTGPHVHFEVRVGQDAVNPIQVLPKNRKGPEPLRTRPVVRKRLARR